MAESPQVTKKGKRKRGRPRESYTRATFIVEEDLLDKIKALAHWERMEIKELVEEALLKHMKGKTIKPLPEKKQKAYKGS